MPHRHGGRGVLPWVLHTAHITQHEVFYPNQRAAQEVLGNSDANLTAQVYTDVPALALHDEIAKLPLITESETGAVRGGTENRRSKSGGVTR